MRDFTWNYFSMTGDVDAYLFYKEMNQQEPLEQEDPTHDSLEEWDEE
jgi:ASC-1-like (ASCH) protein